MKQRSNKRKDNTEPDKFDKVVQNDKFNKEEVIPPPRYGPMPTFPHQRVWTRLVLVISVLTLVWFSSKDKSEIILASRKEVLQQRGQQFPCSQSFANEIASFPKCAPIKCGRFVSDKIVTAAEADAMIKIAKQGFALGGSDGGASILDLHSGALSHRKNFINIYNTGQNSNLIFTPSDIAMYRIVKTKIQHAIAHHFGLHVDRIYLTHPTFFSKLTALEPKTLHDEYWHPHVDKETYESFHYTSLLYLTDYNVDFTGGRLIFIDEKQNVTVEPRKGRVLMFSSGEENVHFVERVASGVRYTITVSFTCDPLKAIADPMTKKKQ